MPSRRPAWRWDIIDFPGLTNGVPDDVVAQVVATRGGDRGHVAQELARQAGPFREALKRVAIATRLGRKIDKDRDAEAGGDDLTDEDIVQRLREMGPCPMGAWQARTRGSVCGDARVRAGAAARSAIRDTPARKRDMREAEPRGGATPSQAVEHGDCPRPADQSPAVLDSDRQIRSSTVADEVRSGCEPKVVEDVREDAVPGLTGCPLLQDADDDDEAVLRRAGH